MAQGLADVASCTSAALRSLEHCPEYGSSGAHQNANYAPCEHTGSDMDKFLESGWTAVAPNERGMDGSAYHC